MLIVLADATAVSAKVLCPPGRFTIRTTGGLASTTLDGAELVLGRGTAALSGHCPAVRSGGFFRFNGNWGSRVRTNWRACRSARALRARWNLEAPYCTRLDGFLRTRSGGRVFFAADRIPKCGNGVRDAGEQCDGVAGTAFAYAQCCDAATCLVMPGCPVLCGFGYPCAGGDEICEYSCGSGGVCKPRAEIACDAAPVCGCDGNTTYPGRCAAFDAGTGVSRDGPCLASPSPPG